MKHVVNAIATVILFVIRIIPQHIARWAYETSPWVNTMVLRGMSCNPHERYWD